MAQAEKIIIGVTVGVAVGIILSCCTFWAVRFCRKRDAPSQSSRELSMASLPMRANGIDSSIDSSSSLSTFGIDHGPQHVPNKKNYRGPQKYPPRDILSSFSGIPRYLYKDIQKATQNFTTVLGQGSFGPVYKAILPAGEVVAVKVLANKSRQGEREFQTEVVLLSRLHHRNLVNLLGYCVDKGQLILVYEFMSNGSLASLLYGSGPRVLNWEERLQIALDVSHGIEYLHDGASPSVVHRDLKSANILLDSMMRAKVADFGLSKEELFDGRKSGLKGTYGYMDPSYMSTNKFTKQSDVYSFGIILFELITVINPQQGLIEYINLAVIGGGDGRPDWDEIIDKKLIGNNIDEIRLLANIAHRCLHKNPARRPTISDITQAISRIKQRQVHREHAISMSDNDPSSVFSRIALQQDELRSLASIKEIPIPPRQE